MFVTPRRIFSMHKQRTSISFRYYSIRSSGLEIQRLESLNMEVVVLKRTGWGCLQVLGSNLLGSLVRLLG